MTTPPASSGLENGHDAYFGINEKALPRRLDLRLLPPVALLCLLSFPVICPTSGAGVLTLKHPSAHPALTVSNSTDPSSSSSPLLVQLMPDRKPCYSCAPYDQMESLGLECCSRLPTMSGLGSARAVQPRFSPQHCPRFSLFNYAGATADLLYAFVEFLTYLRPR